MNAALGGNDPLVVAPVLLPLATAALMLLLGEGRRRFKAALNLGSALLGLALAVALLLRVDAAGAQCLEHVAAGVERDLAFGRVTAEDDRDAAEELGIGNAHGAAAGGD